MQNKVKLDEIFEHLLNSSIGNKYIDMITVLDTAKTFIEEVYFIETPDCIWAKILEEAIRIGDGNTCVNVYKVINKS